MDRARNVAQVALVSRDEEPPVLHAEVDEARPGHERVQRLPAMWTVQRKRLWIVVRLVQAVESLTGSAGA